MSKFLHQEIKNSELYIVSNAKHMATYEMAKEINLRISKFIK